MGMKYEQYTWPMNAIVYLCSMCPSLLDVCCRLGGYQSDKGNREGYPHLLKLKIKACKLTILVGLSLSNTMK